MASDITGIEFTKEGFEILKIEVAVMIELVGHIAAVLTPEQRDVVRNQQVNLIQSQAVYEKAIKIANKDVISEERSIRIKRMLAD